MRNHLDQAGVETSLDELNMGSTIAWLGLDCVREDSN